MYLRGGAASNYRNDNSLVMLPYLINMKLQVHVVSFKWENLFTNSRKKCVSLRSITQVLMKIFSEYLKRSGIDITSRQLIQE